MLEGGYEIYMVADAVAIRCKKRKPRRSDASSNAAGPLSDGRYAFMPPTAAT